MLKEFRAFIVKGNAVDMAIGIIIGAAFTAIVNSLVKDIITPPIGLLMGQLDFTNIFITLKGETFKTLAEAQKAGAVTMNVGIFLNALINLIIVGAATFFLVKAIIKLKGISKDDDVALPTEPTTKECPHCRSSINIKATKCPHCTSSL